MAYASCKAGTVMGSIVDPVYGDEFRACNASNTYECAAVAAAAAADACSFAPSAGRATPARARLRTPASSRMQPHRGGVPGRPRLPGVCLLRGV